MKTINQSELEILVSSLQCLKGFEVQGVYGSDELFGFKFWNKRVSWITCRLKGSIPFIYGPEELVKFDKSTPKPVFTFFNKYFKGALLTDICVKSELGRVVEMTFQSEACKDLRVQLCLFRGGVNFSVFANRKKVFLNKPSNIKISSNSSSFQSRDLKTLKKEITLSLPSKKKSLENDFKELNKKDIAIKKIEQAIQFYSQDPYLNLVKALEQDLKPPKDLIKLMQKSMTKQENVEYLYEQHKLKPEKLERLKRRINELNLENTASTKLSGKKSYKPEVQGIPRLVISEGVVAFCGRKAKENLTLIRKAKAWYLWMHLKDYPSAHIIVEKNKNRDLNENELRKVASFLFFRGAPKKLISSPEVSFEVIFTEIRYVKPIKGDKLGRVTAQNVKSRVYLWKKSDKFSI